MIATHKRWAVKCTHEDGSVSWITMNNGWADNCQTAYLYSKRGVAINKAASAKRNGRYAKTEVVTFVVTAAEEE